MRERTRLAISVGGIAFAVTLIVLVRGLFVAYQTRVADYFDGVDTDIWVLQSGTADFFHSFSLLPTDLRTDLADTPGIDHTTPYVARLVALDVDGTDTVLYLVGYNTKTVRYYESVALMPEPDRTSTGYRDYSPDALERLRFIRDSQATGLSLAIRILKPGGVLLVNFGCVDYYLHGGLDMGTGKPLYMYNWFTPLQVENIFRRLDLTEQEYDMEVYGNLFTRIAFQVNISAEELTARELDTVDPGHPLIICVRVKKPENWDPSRPHYRDPIYIPTDAPARLHPETGHYGDTYI